MKYPLRTLFWEATLNCNAGCPFCGSSCGERRVEDLDGKTVIRAFRELREDCDPAGVMVNVTGGEPLLRKDLFSVMGEIHALGFPWGMVTNGSLITGEVIRQMKETGMSTISVSIDGLFEAHEKQRRLPGAFPKIIDGIRGLGKAGFLECLQITTVVTRENLDDLEEMLAFFSMLPVDSWRIATVDPIGRCLTQQQLLLREEDYETVFAFLDRHAFHEKPVLTTSCSHYLGGRDSRYRPHPFHCEAGKCVGSILADGSIFVCPNVPRRGELVQGNILRNRFAEVWETGFRWFREEENRKKGACASCGQWEQCRGDSLHSWDFEMQQPKFCALEHPCLAGRGKQMPTDALIKRIRCGTENLKGIRLQYGSASSETVVFTPQAAEQLFCIFHWGQYHPVNLCEQMAALVGHVEESTCYVEELIPVALQDRAEETATFSMQQHNAVLQELELMNRMLPESRGMLFGNDAPFQLLGYLHSHPGELKAVLSRPDIHLHNLLRKDMDGPLISGLLNSQHRELCLYLDSRYTPVDAILLMDETDCEKWGLLQ